ncbi:uncharacterized protein LOC123672648 [Harmonia axyridis]|uniref:uncharacterized protein LOC123672648 n=1 Tax=Harmonia axyridis TaxID=115357 RepID=UPI001E279B66|nr:uncharacterized protein LOC123672648 [Harmonia axyridis]
MEKVWKFVCLCLVVCFFKLCNGLPIPLESTIPGTSVQLLPGVIGILLTVCTVFLLVGCLCCHRPSGFKEFRDSPVGVSTVGTVDNGLVNPIAEGAFTIFAPLGHQNFSSSNDRLRLEEEYSYGDINVSSWFNEGVYDFPRTKLKYIKELGKGWFGSVVEGTAQDPQDHTWTPVVVRILDSTASAKEKVFFLHEAEIYRCGNHTNLLKLHGRCLDSEPFLLLQELCPQGDLKGYLWSNRTNNNLLASEYPLIWCCQITSALKFLHEKGLAHSDLACRNCQLTSNLTVKLGDYGLASTKYPGDYYEGIPTISVRWCAPESIRHTSTTIQPDRVTREANVWSLAVCFWEICEQGARPYVDLTDDEVITQVLGKAHVRLPRPSHMVLYTDYIYRLMQSCWLTPESRPTSTQIYLTLTDLLQVFTVCKSEGQGSQSDLQGSQESFDQRWNSLKPNNNPSTAERVVVQPSSPSMNNLIGSMEDMDRSRTSEEDNAHSVLLPTKQNQKFEFELSGQSKEPLETDSLDDSMVYNMRRSSSSETEEENWKKKIERGAYTEKVRQKSKSVTDLMVLTHIDCSESESETPQPSLEPRVTYKNVRLAPKHNLESANHVHGSEGNLLSVQDDFQAELRKLQEEHRDSLFFVPDKYSQTLRNEQVNNNLDLDRDSGVGASSSNERLIKELSGTSELPPVNQVYNVFNVTIDKLSPIHVVKLNEIINLEESLEYGENKTFVSYEVPKLCEIIQNNSIVANLPVDNEGNHYSLTYENGNSDLTPLDTSHSVNCLESPQNILHSPIADLEHEIAKEIPQHPASSSEEHIIGIESPEDTFKEKRSITDTPDIPNSTLDLTKSEIISISADQVETESPCEKHEDTVEEKESISNISNIVNSTLNFIKEEINYIAAEQAKIESSCEKHEEEDKEEPITNNSNTINTTLDLQKVETATNCTEGELEEHQTILQDEEESAKENLPTESIENKPDKIKNGMINFKTEESYVDEVSDIETNEKHDLCVPDNQPICDESVLNDKIILDPKELTEREEVSEQTICNELKNDSTSVTEEIVRENLENEMLQLNGNCGEVMLLSNEKCENIEPLTEACNGHNEDHPSLNLQDLESTEKISLEKVETSESSPSTLQDSLESFSNGDGEKKESEQSCESLELLNDRNKNTLENLYVFQMGEDLNSFEMNSQISDADFSQISGNYRKIESDSVYETEDTMPHNETVVVEEETILKTSFVENEVKRIEESQNKTNCQEDLKTPTEAKPCKVPKLIDLIENNDKLMDFIITSYESELNDDLSCESSFKTNALEQQGAIAQKPDEEDVEDYPTVAFDLSDSQAASNPNPLTHLNAFSSLRVKQKSSLELISSTPSKKPRDSEGENPDDSTNLNYSLETWDNFLGNAIDTQTKNINDQNVVFESLSSEPQSMLFIEGADSTTTPPNSDIEVSLEGGFLDDVYKNQTINIEGEEEHNLDETYEVEESELNRTYDVDTLEGSLSAEDCATDDQDESGTWESSGGWFLHPQSSSSISGQIEQKGLKNSDRFGMDDEILAALRGELLAKLPHAQGSTSDKLKENNEEWDPSEKEEVFLRYNVYNTPLSPIPEESENEDDSDYVCTATGSPASGASDDWPEKLLEDAAPHENDSQSLKAQGLHQQHTLSQDSCCSNDTLFNLEDMTYVVADQEDKTESSSDQTEEAAKKLVDEQIKRDAIDYFRMGTAVGMPLDSPVVDLESPMDQSVPDKTYLADFLFREREHSELVSVVVTEPQEGRSDSNSSQSVPMDKTAAPLPSPDDHPWKQLSDSLLKKGLLDVGRKGSDDSETQDSVTYENVEGVVKDETDPPSYANLSSEGGANDGEVEDTPTYTNESPHYINVNSEGGANDEIDPPTYTNVKDEGGTPHYINEYSEGVIKDESEPPLYEEVKGGQELPSYVNLNGDAAVYENVENVGDILNEEDYVNITNLENAKISADLEKAGLDGELRCLLHQFKSSPKADCIEDDLIIGNGEEEQDDQLFGVLTDIRFSGPGESHLMSTSFSESNDIQNEQDWESGSDTRSSSSGEFIWREGEHEESLKALQALPQDMLDDLEPNHGAKTETSSESSCSDDEGECPEFIPSAWDKYATPTKSALRSPEKTLEKEEKKKGVWFKKQRYHCVYEYPREPDSPILQSFDLWNNPPPATSYPEWYFDIDSTSEFSDFSTATNFTEGETLSTDFNTSFTSEFFVTGSATPFNMMGSTSSQFFPGGDHWSESSKLNDNTTPDSGVEDVTPGSMERLDLPSIGPSAVPSLKLLAEIACASSRQKDKENRTSEILGGLRHTRDKLKLDLPSSPNTFTSNKTFNLEPNVEPVVLRERPAFTTFGKSRFLVQHVDTPDRDETSNVCFEALPYKPLDRKEVETKAKKINKEEEKGEASLLDSADEDSGIESSTLERKSSDVGKLIVDL